MTMLHQEPFHIPTTSLFGDKLGDAARALKNAPVFDAAAGAVVTVLAIVGLGGALPRTMAALAFILVGVAFVSEAAGTSRRSQATLLSQSDVRSQITASVLVELLTGAAGFVLGFLGLVGVAPLVVLPIASVSFGVALWFGTGAAVQMDTVAAYLEPSQTRRVIHEAVVGASGARMLLAVTSVVLGLLSLVGVESSSLLLAVALSLGVALLLGAVSLGDRMKTEPQPASPEDDVATSPYHAEPAPPPARHRTLLGLGAPGGQ